MILKLLALFTIVPLIELALLIPLGMHIGLWPTIGLVLATALIGAFLAKLEGGRAIANIKRDLQAGKLPADSILDGLAILTAGIFLVTPGVLTDVVAIVLLIPPARAPLRAYAKTKFEKMLDTGSMSFTSSGGFQQAAFDSESKSTATPFHAPFAGSGDRGDIIDVTPGASSDTSNSATATSADEDSDELSSP